MGAKHIQILFIPQIDLPLEPPQTLKIRETFINTKEKQKTTDFVKLPSDRVSKWTTLRPLAYDDSFSVEYQYVIVESSPSGETIVSEDIVRKIDFKGLNIDFDKKDSCLSILTSHDTWGSDKSTVSFSQVPIQKGIGCIVLGGHVPTNGLHRETDERLVAFSKIYKEDPKRYSVIVLAGHTNMKTKSVESEAMFARLVELGIEPKLMVQEKEGFLTLESSVFCKIILAKLGFVNVEIFGQKEYKKTHHIVETIWNHPPFAVKFVDDGLEPEKNKIGQENRMDGIDDHIASYGLHPSVSLQVHKI